VTDATDYGLGASSSGNGRLTLARSLSESIISSYSLTVTTE